MTYTEGRQPCADYRPQRDGNAYASWANVHECFGPYDANGKVPGRSCDGRVSFCDTCNRDHHTGGWNKCGDPVEAAA